MTENQGPTTHDRKLAMTSRDVMASQERWVLGHWYSVIGFFHCSSDGTILSDQNPQRARNHPNLELRPFRHEIAAPEEGRVAFRLDGHPRRPPRREDVRRDRRSAQESSQRGEQPHPGDVMDDADIQRPVGVVRGYREC